MDFKSQGKAEVFKGRSKSVVSIDLVLYGHMSGVIVGLD